MIDKSNFDSKQYKADLQSAYDCGYVAGVIEELEEIKSILKENQDNFDVRHRRT